MKTWLDRLSAFFLAVVVVLTLLPLVPTNDWWIRAGDFPRIQIFLFGVLVLLARLALGLWRRTAAVAALAVLTLCLIHQAWMLFPYTPLAPQQSVDSTPESGDHEISVLVANVYQKNRQAGALLDIVRQADPDLFLALETHGWWMEQLAPLEGAYPHRLAEPLDNTYGMILYSKLPLIEPEIRFLYSPEIPSMHAQIDLGNRRTWLHFLHPKPPSPSESKETTLRDAEILIVGQAARERGGPTIIAGDLNDVPWSRTNRLFREVSSMLDPRIGRGFVNTFHAKIPVVRWPLDHVFHSEHFKLAELRRLSGFGSDHFPLLARLTLEPEAPLLQDAPEPEPEDLEEASEAIQEGREEAAEEAAESGGEAQLRDGQGGQGGQGEPVPEALSPPPGGG